MPFRLIRADLTQLRVDAIVNAANNRLQQGGGVCGAIFRAAGEQALQDACDRIGHCETGRAVITPGFALPARYVIHTVGPVWQGGGHGEAAALARCYRRSLELAVAHHCVSVAFPLLSTGAFGYPKRQALEVAMDAISSYLLALDGDLMVYLVLFNKDCFAAGSRLFSGIEQFIDDHYVEQHTDSRSFLRERRAASRYCLPSEESLLFEQALPFPAAAQPRSLEQALEQMDESFSQMVQRKIQEKGMKNADCYKRANLDKKLFSKIRNDPHYKPKKQTALALAVALELPLTETRELLEKAGLALSHSDKFDVIVEYFLVQGNYNIFEINEALFYYDQPLLGSSMC